MPLTLQIRHQTMSNNRRRRQSLIRAPCLLDQEKRGRSEDPWALSGFSAENCLSQRTMLRPLTHMREQVIGPAAFTGESRSEGTKVRGDYTRSQNTNKNNLVTPTGFEPCTIRALEVDGLAESATQTPRARAPTQPRPCVRGVVDRLLTVLMAMLAAQTPYDPARRRAALVQARRPP